MTRKWKKIQGEFSDEAVVDGDTAIVKVLMLEGAEVTDATAPLTFVNDVGAEPPPRWQAIWVNEFGAVAMARIIGGPVRRKLLRNTLATSGNSFQGQISW